MRLWCIGCPCSDAAEQSAEAPERGAASSSRRQLQVAQVVFLLACTGLLAGMCKRVLTEPPHTEQLQAQGKPSASLCQRHISGRQQLRYSTVFIALHGIPVDGTGVGTVADGVGVGPAYHDDADMACRCMSRLSPKHL